MLQHDSNEAGQTDRQYCADREVAMQQWDSWPLERLVYLFLAAGFLLVWIQLSFFHWKAAFHNKIMWGPVLYTPLLILSALAMGLMRAPWLDSLFVVIFAIGVLEGLIGTALHLRGVSRMVGGLNLRNFVAGPPVILAVVFAALCGLGLLTHYWPALTGGGA
jgi:hypothetical protein